MIEKVQRQILVTPAMQMEPECFQINMLNHPTCIDNKENSILLSIVNLLWKAIKTVVLVALKCLFITQGTPRRTTRTCPSGSLTAYFLNMACLHMEIWLTRDNSQWVHFSGPKLFATLQSTSLLAAS